MFELVKGYYKNDILRQSFDALSVETFKLSLEDWYQNGFWGENYNLYSIVEDNKVIAHVSVSITDMMFEGKTMHFIQLGNVMTDKAYRNRGFIRQIITQIEVDYKDKVDGIYLFANDSVLDFYPKFGFEKTIEYQWVKEVTNNKECQFEKIIMDNATAWERLMNVMKRNVFHGKFDMVGNNELIMFYVTKYLQENVYYHKESDSYVIAEIEGDTAFIHNVFSSTLNNLSDVILLFGKEVKRVILGFTPMDSEEYEVLELEKGDTTFFKKGKALDIISQEKLRIPSLAHA